MSTQSPWESERCPSPFGLTRRRRNYTRASKLPDIQKRTLEIARSSRYEELANIGELAITSDIVNKRIFAVGEIHSVTIDPTGVEYKTEGRLLGNGVRGKLMPMVISEQKRMQSRV